MTFTIAIVGRPNVGKSTLFNPPGRRRLALVGRSAGRDARSPRRRAGSAILLSRSSIPQASKTPNAKTLSGRMQAQTAEALAQADAVLFLVDARDSAMPADRAFADLVRKSGKPTILVANKSEGRAGAAGALESYALGLGEPVSISAEHGEGWQNCMMRFVRHCPTRPASPRVRAKTTAIPVDVDKPIRLAVVGRPNTGKSTLINRLLGEDRLLTGPESGITRDAIAVDLTWHGRQLSHSRHRRDAAPLADRGEAGKALGGGRAQRHPLRRSRHRADDSQTPFEEQDIPDRRPGSSARGAAAVIAVNKWICRGEPMAP